MWPTEAPKNKQQELLLYGPNPRDITELASPTKCKATSSHKSSQSLSRIAWPAQVLTLLGIPLDLYVLGMSFCCPLWYPGLSPHESSTDLDLRSLNYVSTGLIFGLGLLLKEIISHFDRLSIILVKILTTSLLVSLFTWKFHFLGIRVPKKWNFITKRDTRRDVVSIFAHRESVNPQKKYFDPQKKFIKSRDERKNSSKT